MRCDECTVILVIICKQMKSSTLSKSYPVTSLFLGSTLRYPDLVS